MLRTQPLRYADGPTPLHGHYAYDDATADRRPGVLVVHEFFGLGDHAKQRAERIAGELGYAALAVDVYGEGKLATDPKDAMALMTPFVNDPDLLRRRMRAGLAALRQQPQVDPGRVAAIGYCFGGRAALELARDGADILAAVGFHGALDTKRPAANGAVTARILSCTGGSDPSIGADKVVAFQHEMDAAGADWQTVVYGGAEHGFTNPKAARPGVRYHPAADRRSWAAMLELFGEVFDNA